METKAKKIFLRIFNSLKQQSKKCLLKKCRCTEMNCRGAELGSYDQSMAINS